MIILLRNTVISEIRNQLNNDFFVSNDFEIIQREVQHFDKLATLVEITYIYQIEFHFSAKFEKSNSIYLTFSPGLFKLEESDYVNSLQFLCERIQLWMSYLKEELSSMPVARQLKENSEKILELESFFKDAPDIDFSKKQIDEIISRLSDLENQFKEELTKEYVNKQELEIEIEKLEREIESLKIQAGMFTQKNWAKSFYSKMWSWIKRHPNTVKEIGNITHKMLPNGVQEVLVLPLSLLETAFTENLEE